MALLYHSKMQCHVRRIFLFIPHSHNFFFLCILQVFAGIFPSDHSDYLGLRAALEKLTLNDSSVELNVDSRYKIFFPFRVEKMAADHREKRFFSLPGLYMYFQ